VGSRKMLCCAAVLVAAALAAAGCGGAHSREGIAETHVRGQKGVRPLSQLLPPAGIYTPDGSWTLVREGIPGGYVSITGKRYRAGRRVYSTLVGRIEQLDKPIVSSGGLPLDSSANPALQMAVYRGCAGTRLYALAYGLLRRPEDAVTARDGARAVVVKKVEIPTSFYPGAMLVYALLGTGATNIVTRTPSGQVVNNVTYVGRAAGTAACRRP
jgi:hypothetical protein